MEIVSNFAMFHIASHFAQFQGISNPFCPVKHEKSSIYAQTTQLLHSCNIGFFVKTKSPKSVT